MTQQARGESRDATGAAGAAPQPPEHDDHTTGEETENVFETLEDFVASYLAVCFPIDPADPDVAWCPDWWRHPEAVLRLTALWEAFEFLRRDAFLGLSEWMRDHATPQLRALRDPADGPFRRCSATLGHDTTLSPLPTVPTPAEFLAHKAFSVYPSDIDDYGYDEDADDETEGGDAAKADSELVFHSIEEFVVLFVSPTFRWDPSRDRHVWCARWWGHPEAVIRLSAMWRSYELSVAQGGRRLSDWVLDHADPHMRALRDPIEGPFRKCGPHASGHVEGLTPMPVTPVPPHASLDAASPQSWLPED